MFKDKDSNHISLRDYFAGLAMQIVASDKNLELQEISTIAYAMADSMLEYRDSTNDDAK